MRITHSKLDYENSCTIDEALMETANIHKYQQIDIYNINNDERFTTYAIHAERNSNTISINDTTTHKTSPNNLLIITTYANYNKIELEKFKPQLIYIDNQNRIKDQHNAIPIQISNQTT